MGSEKKKIDKKKWGTGRKDDEEEKEKVVENDK